MGKVPSDEVLCYVWASNDVAEGAKPEQGELAVYGALSTDVVAAWGQPTRRNGDVWTYEWCIGDCARKATAILTFKQHDLCYNGGKIISGQWLSKIDGDGVSGGQCWVGSLRNQEPTCDGCLNAGDVSRCL